MSHTLHRRTFLQVIAAVAASTAFGCRTDEDGAPLTPSEEHFPQSVASGDPRPDSVVLWTRAVDPAHVGSIKVALQVGTDMELTSLVVELADLEAMPAHDYALKVKVTNLQPRTTYYYRFTYEKDGKRYASPVGRTRTAPASGQDVPVRFVFASCQDFLGRYYNPWQYLVQRNEDLDFIVFLGDYVYETTGDTTFQTPDENRVVRFTDTASALPQGSDAKRYYAASSLSNYRDLYKNVRSDANLRRLHELYPFVMVWDDHEFSDDSWGSTATYSDGRLNEHSDERKRNAEQAFFEYIPLDTTDSAAGAIDVNSAPRYPDTRIYRDFEYGKHLKLILTDYRTHRPDHLIPEDAYPGTVVMDDAALTEMGVAAGFTSDLYSYVDIDAPEYAQAKEALQQAYSQLAIGAGLGAEASAKAVQAVKGKLALAYVNQVLAKFGAQQISPTGKAKGLGYVHLGKTDLFNQVGSRYVVVKASYDLYSAWRYLKSGRASENAFGTPQETWLREKVLATNTWKIVVSSVSLTSMIWDLSDLTDPAVPANLKTKFYFNADQWDGFPNKRAELLKYMTDNKVNALFISGDIHASFASVEKGVPTLTAPAISSSSIRDLAGGAVVAAGYPAGSSVYTRVITEMESTLMKSNPGLAFTNTDAHGLVVLEVGANDAVATYHLIPSTEVKTDYTGKADALTAKFTTKALRVSGGTINNA